MSFASQRGAVSILISLFILGIVTAGVVVLSGVLSQQIRASQDVITTERALYAANSGFEHALYLQIRRQESRTGENPVTGEISYSDEVASYTAQVYLDENADICVLGQGDFRNLVRRLAVGGSTCTFER